MNGAANVCNGWKADAAGLIRMTHDQIGDSAGFSPQPSRPPNDGVTVRSDDLHGVECSAHPDIALPRRFLQEKGVSGEEPIKLATVLDR